MLHENALKTARIKELEEQLEMITQRKGRKRKRIQTGGTIEYGEALTQVAATASAGSQRAKKSRGRGSQETGQPAQRRCRNCGKAGHNARTCKKDLEGTSESDTSSVEEELPSDSNENDN